MSAADDFRKKLQEYTDDSGDLDLRTAVGEPGYRIEVRNETQDTGQAWTPPTLVDGIAEAIGALIDSLPAPGNTVWRLSAVCRGYTASGIDVVLGAFRYNPAEYNSQTVKFFATSYVSAGSLTGHVSLYKLLPGNSEVLVTSLSFSDVITTEHTSAAITFSAGDNVYEIRARVDDGAGWSSSDFVVVELAGLQLS